VATTPVRVEITLDLYFRGVSNLCIKLESDQCRQVLPIVGSWHVNLVVFCFEDGEVPLRCLVPKFMSSMLWSFTTS